MESSLSRRSRDLFTNKEYTKIYTKCYDMCTQRSPYNWSKDLYTRHSAAIKDYLMKTVMPSFNGKHNVHLLNELVKRWKNHRLMNRWMQKFFMYLDRYYVKHHTVPKLNEAGMNLFKEQVFDNIKSDVVEAALEQILKERNGEDVDRSRLAVSIKVFEDMGMGKMTVYEKEFEGDLLKATSLFYKGKSQVWIASDTTPEYLKKAERALRDEDERVKHYLNPSTAPKLLRNVEIELLKEYEMVLLNKEGSGCRALLKGDRKEDLKRMCELFSRPGVCSRCRSLPPSFSLSLSFSICLSLSHTHSKQIPDGLVPMAKIVKQHIEEMGMTIVSQREATIKDSKTKETPLDLTFVKSLLKLHAKYQKLVEEEFSSNALFQKAMKDAFEVFVNKSVGKFSNAQMLSTFCDRILKTGGEKMSDEVIEKHLDDVVQLFGYLTEKDLFGGEYEEQLSKRLLNGRSKSDHAERFMIGKLKLICGAQFTSKMEGMLNDLNVASDQNAKFKKYLSSVKKTLPIQTFKITILTTGFWPKHPDTTCTLPPNMADCVEKFSKWHSNSTSHRTLKFAYGLGKAVVRGQFGKWYDFQVSTLQAILLIRLNEIGDKAATYAELKTLTNMRDEILKRVLHSFACTKFRVLLKSPKGKTVKPEDRFKINPKFACPMRSIRISMPLLTSSANSSKNTKKRVKENQDHMVEAAIVRIMKARRVLVHGELVKEVMVQLKTFQPDPKVVKQRIEDLISREYLERDKEKSDTYHYVA